MGKKKIRELKELIAQKDRDLEALRTSLRQWEIALHTANVANLRADVDRSRYRANGIGFVVAPPTPGVDEDTQDK